MSDPWSRPTDDGGAPPPDQVLEIELDGPGGAVEPSPGTPSTDQPNWRKVVALSSIAGVVLGAVVATIVVTSGDDADVDPSRPAVDQSADDSPITAPETLPPVVEETTEEAPVISGRPDLPLELPTYEDTLIPTRQLDDFVLDADLLAEQRADRVEIEVTTEDGLGARTAIIEYDSTADRYLVTYDQRGPVQRVLIDATSEAIYITNGVRNSAEWEVIADANAAESAAAIYRDLLLSPIRPDTLPSAAISAGMGVTLESGVVARRYRVAMPAVAIPEWTSGGGQPATPGASHVLEAYVDVDGRLAVVQGTVVVDGSRQLIVYRFDHDADVSIDLPDVDSSVVEPGRRITEGT